MPKTRLYLRGLLSSWAGYGANIVVMFFLSPFVVHSLGAERYGVWSLLMTVTGYLGLVELGVRASTGRFINFYIGKARPDKVDQVINTSLAFYCLASVMVLLVAMVVGMNFTSLFPKISTELAHQASTILLLMAINVWLGLWSATFAQLLFAANRFDLLNAVSVLTLGVRAGGTVWALGMGYGLTELAMVLVTSSMVSFVLLVAASRWKGVRVHFGFSLAKLSCFREIFSFGSWAFLSGLSNRIIDYTSAALIALLLGAAEITYFAIGYMILDSGRELLTYIVRVLTPDIQKAAGREGESLAPMMIRATNATMLVAVPMLGGMLILGDDFILQWMGPQFYKSGVVLMLVTISQFGSMAGMSCGTILNAMGHVKLVALLAALEAVLNLACSVVLVKYFNLGIYGVALGMTIPTILISNIALVVAACRRLHTPLGPFVSATFGRWGPALALFLPLCLAVSSIVTLGGYAGIVVKAAVSVALYLPAGAILILGYSQSVSLLQNMLSIGRRKQELKTTVIDPPAVAPERR